jgi:hypothetical protein
VALMFAPSGGSAAARGKPQPLQPTACATNARHAFTEQVLLGVLNPGNNVNLLGGVATGGLSGRWRSDRDGDGQPDRRNLHGRGVLRPGQLGESLRKYALALVVSASFVLAGAAGASAHVVTLKLYSRQSH